MNVTQGRAHTYVCSSFANSIFLRLTLWPLLQPQQAINTRYKLYFETVKLKNNRIQKTNVLFDTLWPLWILMPAIIIPTKGGTSAFCTAELGLVGLTFSGCRRGKRRDPGPPPDRGRCTGLGSWRPRVWLCDLAPSSWVPGWPGAHCFPFLKLSFFICKMGMSQLNDRL